MAQKRDLTRGLGVQGAFCIVKTDTIVHSAYIDHDPSHVAYKTNKNEKDSPRLASRRGL